MREATSRKYRRSAGLRRRSFRISTRAREVMRAPRVGSGRIRFVVIRIQNIYATGFDVNPWSGVAAAGLPHGPVSARESEDR